MSKKKAISKYAVDTSLFKPEPPADVKLVKALFAGRDAQLTRGYETLSNQCDVNGKRSKSFDKRPWVIHGESRSGKSHLARRILAEFRPNPMRLQFLVPAREKIEAPPGDGRPVSSTPGPFSHANSRPTAASNGGRFARCAARR